MSESQDTTKTPGKVSAFLKDVDSEFRKITWPRGKELVETTKTVTCFILVLALFVWLCDVVLRWAITQVIA
ncbi:MAG: preprotein translocase subunit SecE [Treponema sp.]|nr:preprotein translocase subunit SecE [Treponema sp.]